MELQIYGVSSFSRAPFDEVVERLGRDPRCIDWAATILAGWGYALLRDAIVKPCIICGAPTPWRDLDSQAAVCSPACLHEFYSGFFAAAGMRQQQEKEDG